MCLPIYLNVTDLHKNFRKVGELAGTLALLHRCDEVPIVIWDSGSIERVTFLYTFLTPITNSD